MANLCREALDPTAGLDSAWLDCMASEITKGGGLENPDNAYFVCNPHPDIQSQKSCLEDYLGQDGTFHFYHFDALNLCKIPEAGRSCILELLKSNSKFDTLKAQKVCAVKSQTSRACLKDFVLQENGFADSRLDSWDEVQKVCEITNRKDRECIFSAMKKTAHPNAASKDHEFKSIWNQCLFRSEEKEACSQLIFERLVGKEQELLRDVAREICGFPAFEVRACIYDRVVSGSLNALRWYELRCSVDFYKNLEAPFLGDAHGIGCEFKP
ncbi:hypothetical protein WDW37_11070 [Bdellovibrionota bacterium FG-1]